MKKTILLAVALFALAACRENKNEEVSSESELNAVSSAENSITAADTSVVVKTIEKTDATSVANAGQTAEEVQVVTPAKAVKIDYASFGDKITAANALSQDQMIKKYKSLKPGDTVAVAFKSKINAVCQKKGCWMSMALPGGKESFVKFKDYAFFVPLNAADQEAIVSGKAFISETSVAQLRHYAKDGGQSEDEIAKINEPKVEYKFMADGVLISK